MSDLGILSKHPGVIATGQLQKAAEGFLKPKLRPTCTFKPVPKPARRAEIIDQHGQTIYIEVTHEHDNSFKMRIDGEQHWMYLDSKVLDSLLKFLEHKGD